MSERPMTMVIAYDIERDNSRRRVSDMLEACAARVQRSVFEARLTAREADQLFSRLEAELGPDDNLRMYALSASGLARSRVAGGAPLPEDGDYWLL